MSLKLFNVKKEVKYFCLSFIYFSQDFQGFFFTVNNYLSSLASEQFLSELKYLLIVYNFQIL